MLITSKSYAELRAEGMTRADIERALKAGEIVRARRDTYLPGEIPDTVLRAAQLGGRLDCLSLLAEHGVFVHDPAQLHVHFQRTASRLPRREARVRAHWRSTGAAPRDTQVPIVEALVQSALCQSPRYLIATLDSAWNHGLVDEVQIADVFAALPRRYRRLRRLLDPSAESGPETLVRLMLQSLGLRWRSQVTIPTVGRVDFVVEGWLIIECDSKAHHSSWEAQRQDRLRDRAAATAGFATLRLIAQDILYSPEIVRAAIAGLVPRARAGRFPRAR